VAGGRQRGVLLTSRVRFRGRLDSQGTIKSLFGVPRALVGVIHAQALPGTPANRLAVSAIARIAAEEAAIYAAAGFHGLILENTFDRPYVKGNAVGPEIVTALAVIGAEIRRASQLPLGIQVLAGANRGAIAAAHACGASFVRVEGFVFAHVADEGIIESSAGDLLRYRRAIGAENVRVFADIKKKHSAHAITADVDIVETAKAAEFFSVDGVVVSGTATGSPADAGEVQAVSGAIGVPTIVGSGITPGNLARYPGAEAFFVGSSVKSGGVWSGQLDASRTRAVVEALAAL
jgi:membrane complex biogenesis BtpA family protein